MQIRPAQHQDAEHIAAAEALVAATPGLLIGVPHEIPLSAYQQLIAELQSSGLYIVGEAHGQLVGHLILEPMGMQQLAHVLRLSIVIHPNKQGQGLGRQLLQHAIDWAQQHPKFDKIELNVRAGNQRAIALYQSLGFVQEGRFARRVKLSPTQYIDDISMGLLV